MGTRAVPVYVAELVLALAAFERHGDVEGAAGGHGAADSGHGDHGDVFDLYVGGWFRDEYEALFETVEMSFVGLDGAFDGLHSMVTIAWLAEEVVYNARGVANLVKSFDEVIIFLPERPLKTEQTTFGNGASYVGWILSPYLVRICSLSNQSLLFQYRKCETYSVMFRSTDISSSIFSCITTNGYLVCP